ncbi:MAG: tetratricopeptide repeat protein [Nitrospiria bacterium]
MGIVCSGRANAHWRGIMVDKSLLEEIDRLNHRLAGEPGSRLFVPLAEAYLKCGRPKDAISVLIDGIEKNPSLVAARVLLGKVYREQKRLSEAKAQFLQAIEINPDNIASLRNLACIYQDEGDGEKAIACTRKILRIDPGDKEALNALQKMEPMRGGTITAGAPLSMGSSSHTRPTGTMRGGDDRANSTGEAVDTIATPTLAGLYMGQGAYQEAADIYRILLAKRPTDFESRAGLKLALAKLRGQSKSVDGLGASRKNHQKISRLRSWLNAIQREKTR